ncbi:MAG TPA: hypothetical protein VGP82_21060 [Ktedonobacterales bacterium]|nr:hypothetical protein [Ktedonobacterales bacterium]
MVRARPCDQLQLLQVLDFFAGRDLGDTRLSLIFVATHPQVTPFYALGQRTPEQLEALFPARGQVTDDQLQLAHIAWQAFRSPNPTALETMLATDATALPFLRGALLRHLEEFPATEDGLSHTEREILERAVAGGRRPGPLFRAWMEREQAPFMGDAPFFAHVHALSQGAHPPLMVRDNADGVFTLPGNWDDMAALQAQEHEVTPTGRAVLAGEARWIHLAGIDRWLGGVHLHGPAAQWRWSRQDGGLVPLAS